MDTWDVVRTALIVAVWLAVGGGALMAVVWIASGGFRAVGPEDELLSEMGVGVQQRGRLTSFSSAQVVLHGSLGLTTAAIVTYAVVDGAENSEPYLLALAVGAIAVLPGAAMFHKWRTGVRPDVARAGVDVSADRVEDRIPRAVAYLHGAAAAVVVALLLVALFLD